MTPVAATNTGSPRFRPRIATPFPLRVPAQELRRCGEAIVAAGYMIVVFIAYVSCPQVTSFIMRHSFAKDHLYEILAHSSREIAGSVDCAFLLFILAGPEKLGTMQALCRGCLAEL